MSHITHIKESWHNTNESWHNTNESWHKHAGKFATRILTYRKK